MHVTQWCKDDCDCIGVVLAWQLQLDLVRYILIQSLQTTVQTTTRPEFPSAHCHDGEKTRSHYTGASQSSIMACSQFTIALLTFKTLATQQPSRPNIYDLIKPHCESSNGDCWAVPCRIRLALYGYGTRRHATTTRTGTGVKEPSVARIQEMTRL